MSNPTVVARFVPVLALLALGAACAAGSESRMEPSPSPTVASAPAPMDEAEMAREAPARSARAGKGPGNGFGAGRRADNKVEEGGDGAASPAEPEVADAEGQDAPERTRSWFPEAFLWQPLVETAPDGTATVPFTVPDSLTQWRILALAHDASGQQTGAVATFESSLPVYVDPVVPGWLHAGDRLLLPIQVMNNTAEPVQGTLTVEATGPWTGSGSAAVNLSAGGSDVRSLPLVVTGAGEARLVARLRAGDASDAAERTIPVRPSGRPVTDTAGGTLTDERPLAVDSAPGADPGTQELEVVLFGGPLAVLQAELGRLGAGARPVDAAYGFALSARAEALGAAAGTPVAPETLRKVRLLAWQRVVREARAADAGRAADLLASMSGDLGVEAAGPVRTALLRAVVDGQRADGTWGRRNNAPLQELLVNTAWTARTVPESQQASRLRASASLERFLHEVKDPYTAAVLLASGRLDGDAAAPLLQLLTEAIRRDEDGTPRIEVPPGIVNPWGYRPPPAEVVAFAVLALPDGPERRDLAATLLAGWSASGGFGAGMADVLALEAVTAALPATTGEVAVSLLADGAVVASGRFDPARPGEPLLLQGRPAPGATLSLRADPPVGGVAFVATRRSWVPWSATDRLAGVDVTVEPRALVAGKQGEVGVEVLAPAGRRVTVEIPLPPGMSTDRDSLLAANVGLTAGQVTVATDRVILTTSPFAPATIQRFVLRVTPTFGGEFGTEPLLVSFDGSEPVAVRPPRFTVAAPPGS
jgi:hypothetical protein